eukprot:scaffold55254_cov60-Phaeocystis_antarctica.AAC.1
MGARRQRLTPSGVVIQSVRMPVGGATCGPRCAHDFTAGERAGARPIGETTQGWWTAMLKFQILGRSITPYSEHPGTLATELFLRVYASNSQSRVSD